MDSVGVRNADGDILPGGPTDERTQDRGDSVQALPGGRGAGTQGIHPEDDGRGEELQGAAVVADTMPGMQEGSDKGVTGDAPQKPAQSG